MKLTQPTLLCSSLSSTAVTDVGGSFVGNKQAQDPWNGGAVLAGLTEAEERTVKARLDALREEAVGCTDCRLSRSRTNVVFGEGGPRARVLFVGGQPDTQADRDGRLLRETLRHMLEVAGIPEDAAFFTTAVMCKPPGRRSAVQREHAKCRRFLDAKIEILQPGFVVLMGSQALKSLLWRTAHIEWNRGEVLDWNGVRYLPIYAPGTMIREPEKEPIFWEDVRKIGEMYRALGPREGAASAGLEH